MYLERLMKSLLEFKKDSIRIPEKEIENIWIKFQYIFSTWDISEEKIYSFDIKKFSDVFWKNFKNIETSIFEVEFLKAIILHSLDLKGIIFWENSFDIEHYVEQDVTPYDTYTYHVLQFIIKDQKEVMISLKGENVYDNIRYLDDFIKDSGGIYNKLRELKKLFPVRYK